MITKNQYKILKNLSNGIEPDYNNQEINAIFLHLHSERFIITKDGVFILSGKGYQAIEEYRADKRKNLFKWISFLITSISAIAAVIAALK